MLKAPAVPDIEWARMMPVGLAWYVMPRWEMAPHLSLVNDRLMKVAQGRIRRLLIEIPPRTGKSTICARFFCPWFLGRFPEKKIIYVSYSGGYAGEWGRRARDVLEEHGPEVFGVRVSQASSAADAWEIEKHGGAMVSVGAGGSITGRGADVLLVDDPTKSDAELRTLLHRDRLWEWYSSVVYTRLEDKDAAVILIQCMTGDTPVLMADGREVSLREVSVGDQIATYDNGRLSVSTVRHHRSNGHDAVFRIRMVDGRVVCANARHPFLVEEGKEVKWVQLKDLTTAHRIVTAKDSGGSGRERVVSRMAAKSQQSVGVIACRTTTRKCGLMGIGPPLSTRAITGIRISNIGMESLLLSTMPCLRRKVASALSVDGCLATAPRRIGLGSCASIMTMRQTLFEGFSATIATSLSGISRQRKPRLPWPHISAFTAVQVASIEPAGVEEVFDLQIEGTENFIANGLVSHNTRWSEDDLAGRVLQQMEEGGEQWERLRLPAIAETDDPLGRAEGEALWPARFPLERLEEIRTTLGTYYWSSLFQQRPTPAGGGMFRREWFSVLEALPTRLRSTCRYWDLAATEEGRGDPDYTVGLQMGIGQDGRIYVLDVARTRASDLHVQKLVKETAMLDGRGTRIYVEQEPGASGKSLGRMYVRELAGFDVHAEPPEGDKVTRARPFAAQCEAGNVVLVRGNWNRAFLDELTSFPHGGHDDQVDAASGAFNKLTGSRAPVIDRAIAGGRKESLTERLGW